MGKLFLLSLAHLLTLAASSTAGTPAPLNLPEQSPTHLWFFWHNQIGGRKASAEIIGRGSNTKVSRSQFGGLFVFDDSLTVGPEASSQRVGRAQGMYLSADQKVTAVLMVMTFVFSGPEYNGSTLVVVGRNQVALPIREMPIVGGSGVFRSAAGYVHASPSSDDVSTGTFIVEYNCFITYT